MLLRLVTSRARAQVLSCFCTSPIGRLSGLAAGFFREAFRPASASSLPHIHCIGKANSPSAPASGHPQWPAARASEESLTPPKCSSLCSATRESKETFFLGPKPAIRLPPAPALALPSSETSQPFSLPAHRGAIVSLTPGEQFIHGHLVKRGFFN